MRSHSNILATSLARAMGEWNLQKKRQNGKPARKRVVVWVIQGVYAYFDSVRQVAAADLPKGSTADM